MFPSDVLLSNNCIHPLPTPPEPSCAFCNLCLWGWPFLPAGLRLARQPLTGKEGVCPRATKTRIIIYTSPQYPFSQKQPFQIEFFRMISSLTDQEKIGAQRNQMCQQNCLILAITRSWFQFSQNSDQYQPLRGQCLWQAPTHQLNLSAETDSPITSSLVLSIKMSHIWAEAPKPLFFQVHIYKFLLLFLQKAVALLCFRMCFELFFSYELAMFQNVA